MIAGLAVALLLSCAVAWEGDFQPQHFTFRQVLDSPSGLEAVFRVFASDGLVAIDEVPKTQQATHQLAKLLIPSSHEPLEAPFWTFGHCDKACLSDFTTGGGAHLSYANGPILPHTDGTYIRNPPRAKLMHVIEFDGSEYPNNFFIDGKAALRKLTPEDVEMLKRPVPIRHPDENGVWEFDQPVVKILDSDWGSDGCEADNASSFRVAWNVHDRIQTPPEVEEASRAFERVVNDTQAKFHVQLQPGQAWLMDNWRVLHGRSGYAGAGTRRMVGGDFPDDAFAERWQELQQQLGKR
eukprot:gb/GFBE01016392.1/.p1 GENE.gb/GFBE01016392.1/~~gb/GFBE01016392.1/.p1  ORF type:complete len:295 (+),score=56.79 gb/GFBE01016392.1/:1-885(+)